MRSEPRSHSVRCLTLGLLALLLLGNTGCLVFEKQTIVILTPKEGKEAKILLLYEGFHVSSDQNAAKDLARAKKELESLATRKSLFYLGHWMLRYDLKEVKGDTPKAKAVKAMLRKQIRVDEVTFFEADGKLCGYQLLTVPNSPELLAELNETISKEALVMGGPATLLPALDKTSINMIEKAARNEHQWLTMKPGLLEFHVPASAKGVRTLEGTFLDIASLDRIAQEVPNLAKANAPEREKLESTILSLVEGHRTLMEAIRDNPIGFRQTKEGI